MVLRMYAQEYDEAINDLHEIAEQREGRDNRIDTLMSQAEKVRYMEGVCGLPDFFISSRGR